MNANKICFIHIRPQQDSMNPQAKGGFTLAWKVTDAGDIVIGRPAICVSADYYNKEVGRGIAQKRLEEDTPAAVVTADEFRSMVLTIQPEHLLHPNSPFTKSAKDKIFDLVKELLERDPLNNLSSNVFEMAVQHQFVVVDKPNLFKIGFKDGTSFKVKK